MGSCIGKERMFVARCICVDLEVFVDFFGFQNSLFPGEMVRRHLAFLTASLSHIFNKYDV